MNHSESLPPNNPARSGSSGPVRFASLDALRTIAFVIVFLYHLGGTFSLRFPDGSLARATCKSMASLGALGTNTFFILSAFFLHQSIQYGSSWTGAVRRRMMRIYPSYVLVLSVYLLLAPLSSSI